MQQELSKAWAAAAASPLPASTPSRWLQEVGADEEDGDDHGDSDENDDENEDQPGNSAFDLDILFINQQQ